MTKTLAENHSQETKSQKDGGIRTHNSFSEKVSQSSDNPLDEDKIPDINFLKQKKIEVDKKIVVGCKCSYCMNGKELSKALSLGIEVCENIVKQNERLEKCSICKRVFWDKRCPDCIREILDKQMKEILEMIDKVYKKYDDDFSSTDFDVPFNIDGFIEELKAQLKGDTQTKHFANKKQ